jgi:hypothetical protein
VRESNPELGLVYDQLAAVSGGLDLVHKGSYIRTRLNNWGFKQCFNGPASTRSRAQLALRVYIKRVFKQQFALK